VTKSSPYNTKFYEFYPFLKGLVPGQQVLVSHRSVRYSRYSKVGGGYMEFLGKEEERRGRRWERLMGRGRMAEGIG